MNSISSLNSSSCVSAKNCNPLALSDHLPRVVKLKATEFCEDKSQVLVEFLQWKWLLQRPFDPNTTLLGEGSWDAEKNQLCDIACRFLDATDSFSNAHVGDFIEFGISSSMDNWKH